MLATKRNRNILVGLIILGLFLLFALMASFIGVTIDQYGRGDSTQEELRNLEERISLLNSTLNSNTTALQEEIEELTTIIETLIIQIGDTNSSLRDELDNLRDTLNMLNMTLTEDINELIVSNTTQSEEIEQLRMELFVLQSQFALFLNQIMNGTSGGGGGGGGGMMMTLPPAGPGSSYVNFNSTPFLLFPSQPNCCIGYSSGGAAVYNFDYVNRGQTVGDANVTQTILQNYYSVAFRMIDGLILPPGAYNVDFFLDITKVSGNGIPTAFWVSWIKTSWWNTPFGIDFSLPPAPGGPANQAALLNLGLVTNRIGIISVTNPAGTQAAYMSINNFFISTGTESLFIMGNVNPMGSPPTYQINSFQVNFNKI